MSGSLQEVQMNRRTLLRRGAAGAALGFAGLALPGVATAAAAHGISGSKAAIEGVRELQASFHRAKTTQDLDLMTSLWAPDATLVNLGDANSPYGGQPAIRAFFQNSGSFTHRRLSLVPSFKIQIDVGHTGDHAWLYFECHDIGDYDLPTRFIAADLSLYGLVRKLNDTWVFSEMTAGKSFPLSADQIYS
jgi:hypothetical protein